MKYISIFIILSCVFPRTVFMVKQPVNGRVVPSTRGRVVKKVLPGCELKIVDKYAHYVYVKLTGNTDHVGAEGWIWEKRAGDGVVIEEAVCLRKDPIKKNNNLICKAKVGSEFKLIKRNYTWVKVIGECLNKAVWVWSGNVFSFEVVD